MTGQCSIKFFKFSKQKLAAACINTIVLLIYFLKKEFIIITGVD
jgi:hypothetical protein